jgi:hypothetical protein
MFACAGNAPQACRRLNVYVQTVASHSLNLKKAYDERRRAESAPDSISITRELNGLFAVKAAHGRGSRDENLRAVRCHLLVMHFMVTCAPFSTTDTIRTLVNLLRPGNFQDNST